MYFLPIFLPNFGRQSHQCVRGNTVQLVTEVSVHAPCPPQGVSRARWDKDIPVRPNPPLIQTALGHLGHLVVAGCDTAWDRTRICSDASNTSIQCSLTSLTGLMPSSLTSLMGPMPTSLTGPLVL